MTLSKLANDFEEQQRRNILLPSMLTGTALGAVGGTLAGDLLEPAGLKRYGPAIGATAGLMNGAIAGGSYDWFRNRTPEEYQSAVAPLTGAGLGFAHQVHKANQLKPLMEVLPDVNPQKLRGATAMGAIQNAGIGAAAGTGFDWLRGRRNEE